MWEGRRVTVRLTRLNRFIHSRFATQPSVYTQPPSEVAPHPGPAWPGPAQPDPTQPGLSGIICVRWQTMIRLRTDNRNQMEEQRKTREKDAVLSSDRNRTISIHLNTDYDIVTFKTNTQRFF